MQFLLALPLERYLEETYVFAVTSGICFSKNATTKNKSCLLFLFEFESSPNTMGLGVNLRVPGEDADQSPNSDGQLSWNQNITGL